MLYRMFSLVICFIHTVNSAYVSILISQFISPCLSLFLKESPVGSPDINDLYFLSISLVNSVALKLWGAWMSLNCIHKTTHAVLCGKWLSHLKFLLSVRSLSSNLGLRIWFPALYYNSPGERSGKQDPRQGLWEWRKGGSEKRLSRKQKLCFLALPLVSCSLFSSLPLLLLSHIFRVFTPPIIFKLLA